MIKSTDMENFPGPMDVDTLEAGLTENSTETAPTSQQTGNQRKENGKMANELNGLTKNNSKIVGSQIK